MQLPSNMRHVKTYSRIEFIQSMKGNKERKKKNVRNFPKIALKLDYKSYNGLGLHICIIDENSQ
jgi:hypothetical protein